MNKETARSLFMDYLYDELEQDQRNELELFLSQNPELKKELDELSDVRSMISHLPVQHPAERLVMVEPHKSGLLEWWNELIGALLPQNGSARAGFAVASLLVVFVVIGAFTKLNITVDNGSFNLSFGEKQEIIQQGFTPQQVDMLLQQVREDNAIMISDAIQQAQQQQEIRIEKTLVNFADYIEQQRQTDLQMITSGLYSMEETYYDRFRQTDQVLGELIQTVSTGN
jgi:hypothetical protein